jgi:hypothetical protein
VRQGNLETKFVKEPLEHVAAVDTGRKQGLIVVGVLEGCGAGPASTRAPSLGS